MSVTETAPACLEARPFHRQAEAIMADGAGAMISCESYRAENCCIPQLGSAKSKRCRCNLKHSAVMQLLLRLLLPTNSSKLGRCNELA